MDGFNTRGTTTQYVYSGDNLVETIDPLGRVTADQYDAANQPTAEQSPSPADGSNNQTFDRSTASGPVTSVVYDTAGNPIQEFDAAGNETDNVYDAMANLLSTTGPAPTPGAARPTESFTYNADGQILTETNALGATTQFVYDSFGEKVKEIDPSPDGGHTPGAVLQWSYGPDGNVTSYTDALGNVSQYQFNDRNEMVSRRC